MASEVRESALVVAPGARAAEAQLLDEVAARIERRDAAVHAALTAGDTPRAAASLGPALRIVVPSRSLREHVSAALLRRFGRSLASVVVHTHWALALAVVERADETAPRGDELFRVLIRRFAGEEAALSSALGDLHEGYGIVEATARDLVDAGFAAASAEALDDLLAELGHDEAERMRAVARATARALAAIAGVQRAPRAALLQRAGDLLRASDGALLPTEALWVYGFADATGVVADWIEVLQRVLGARVLVSVPPDPFEPGDAEAEFSRTFVERVQLAADQRESLPLAADAAPAIELVCAPGSFAEVRAVAQRIRRLLDARTPPEAIGVVARRFEAHHAAIVANFARLGIPFSASGVAAASDARMRRVAAVVRLLVDAEHTAVDAWLTASAGSDDADLRVGLHVLGAGRLADLARLDLAAALGEREALVLPVRRGAPEDDEQSDERDDAPRAVPRVRSRVLHRDRLERAHARASALVDRLAKWPEHTTFAEHEAHFAQLVQDDLRWDRDDPALAPVFASLDLLTDEVPASFALARREFAALVARALEHAPGPQFGGAGAGVQLLSVMSARGRVFEHLFVLGLERDVFPRTPAEDPIASDRLRRALRTVLAELPVKAQGRAEERHLFAELLASSPRITLSWQSVNDEGREVARSSFVERLCLQRPELRIDMAPPLLGARRADTDLRPAHEHAVRAALFDSRASLAPIRTAALDEVRDRLGGGDAIGSAALARTQLAILDEIDPDRRTRAGRERSARLGPFFGYVGAQEDGAPDVFVTRLEALARCPWQSFLRKELRLEPVPDALDALPAPSPLVIGNVVHAVLQRIVDRGRGAAAARRETIDAALARGVVTVTWPEPDELASILTEEAARVARDEGVRIESFVRALARRAAAMIEVARARDFDHGELPVLGAELTGALEVRDGAGRPRRIAFIADRVDRDDGGLRLTDYKTGKPPCKPGKLAEVVAQGRALQGVAYLLGARARGGSAEGRLLFLREDLGDDERELAARPDDTHLIAAFEQAARTALTASEAGTLFPRLVVADKDQEPSPCDWCEVAAGCLRGESSQRARLRDWAAAAAGRLEALDVRERALFDAFALARGRSA